MNPDMAISRTKRQMIFDKACPTPPSYTACIDDLPKVRKFRESFAPGQFFLDNTGSIFSDNGNKPPFTDDRINMDIYECLNDDVGDMIGNAIVGDITCPFCGARRTIPALITETNEEAFKCTCKNGLGPKNWLLLNVVLASSTRFLHKDGEAAAMADVSINGMVVLNGPSDSDTVDKNTVKAENSVTVGSDSTNPFKYHHDMMETLFNIFDIYKEDYHAFFKGETIVNDETSMIRYACLNITPTKTLLVDTSKYKNGVEASIWSAFFQEQFKLLVRKNESEDGHNYYFALQCKLTETETEAWVCFPVFTKGGVLIVDHTR